MTENLDALHQLHVNSRRFDELTDEEFESVLDDPSQRGALKDYFGNGHLEEIDELRDQGRRRSQWHEEVVLILPGIMGSELAVLEEDFSVLWLNLLQVARGRLLKLRLDQPVGAVRTASVLRRYYYKAKRFFEARGYETHYCPFDWRLSVAESSVALRQRIAELGKPVHVFAHSMGGLVARQVADPSAPESRFIRSVVQLGTPNYGSYAPVLAFRGSNRTARLIAMLDQFHDITDYRRDLFMKFPGLYEMLPSPQSNGTNMFDLQSWPEGDLRPDPFLLQRAKATQQALYRGDDRFFLIAGIDRETHVAARLDTERREFIYDLSEAGDGTVPLELAKLDNIPVRFTTVEHGALANNLTVAQAAAELMETGSSDSLPDRWFPTRKSIRRASDRQLQEEPLSVERRLLEEEGIAPRLEREFLDGLLSVGDVGARPVHKEVSSPIMIKHHRVFVTPNTERRPFEIRIIEGNLINVRAPVYILGLYEGVQPTGAARAVDALVDGKIKDLVERRSLVTGRGQLSFHPTARQFLLADQIAFVGLGRFGEFHPSLLEQIGETVVWHFEADRINEITTVPIGLGSGFTAYEIISAFLRGVVGAIRDRDEAQIIRAINFCDLDRRNCDDVAEAIYSLCQGDLFSDFQVSISRHRVPRDTPMARTGGDKDPYYLHLNWNEGPTPETSTIRGYMLSADANATITPESVDVPRALIEKLLADIDASPHMSVDLGRRVAELLLPARFRAQLGEALSNRHPVVILHDDGASRVPWEVMAIDDRYPAREVPVSRYYLTSNVAATKWSPPKHRRTFNLLLIADPTGDLVEAEKEGMRLLDLLANRDDILVEPIFKGAATGDRLKAELSSGRYDALHYAGHAFFNPEAPQRSGLILARSETLTGEDVAQLPRLPGFLFFNACEAARIRRDGTRDVPRLRRGQNGAEEVTPTVGALIERNIGLAEAFLRGGVAHYLGTYWPVGDDAARQFAEALYNRLLDGEKVGEAIRRARLAVTDQKDWADYVHYGYPNFRLRTPS